MIVVRPSATILTEIDGLVMLRRIEAAGRTCYKSEARITADSATRFVYTLLHPKDGGAPHESVIEHESVSVRFVCDRGVSHELVRHRLASFSQESTRYCNYGKAGEIAVIEPPEVAADGMLEAPWRIAVTMAEATYLAMIRNGASPQIARSVLPTCLKTEIIISANLREWRLIFRQRTSPKAHPQMRELMVPLLAEFKRLIPVVFDDILEAL